ncbi:MAG: ribonuclease P protein component [Spirochaetes bacterium]|nr:ribonuclease P protein component [Spirochaetota bacterium]
MKKEERIKRNYEIKNIFNKGAIERSVGYIFYFIKNELDINRLCIVVKKKLVIL